MKLLIPELAYLGIAGAGSYLAWAVRGRSATVFGPSVWQGPKDRKAIALTFDDGPSESTAELCEYLETQGARGTFFQIGKNVERLPHVSRRVAEGGHEIGNHSHSHAPFYLRHAYFIEDDLYLGQDAIYRAAGVVPQLLRAPYGCRWFGMGKAQERQKLLGVMWSAIGLDWKLDAKEIHRRLKSAARNGAIFCLHDGRALKAKPDIANTLEAVRKLVPQLREQGYELVTVSDLLCKKPISNESSA